MSREIYSRAVHELFQCTCGRFEDRDRIKVVQLFDRLLKRDHSIHVDDLHRLCREAGYDKQTADNIGHLYDALYLIRHELEDPRTIDYWPPETIERMINGADRADT